MSHSSARISGHIALLTLALQPVAPAAQTGAHTQPTSRPTLLPIRRVALYKNGVGFFEHIGTVHGDESVTIDFTTAQLNDVLQTLTAIDLGGGRIAGAGYNSTTPLEQQLKSLPLALSEDPTADDFYAAIRGARVEVAGAGLPITGRILNIEVRNAGRDKKDDAASMLQKHVLTVVSDAGKVRSVELGSNTSVRLLDETLHAHVRRYLETLAGNQHDGLRHLTLMDHGSAGSRELRVSYISEVPVWKSTYRILFDGGSSAQAGSKTATLQGWAVVDNTVGTDWENVQLSLIAGAPQSFLQPISQPYYNRRPEIGLPQEAQLTPQTHESGEPTLAQGVAGAGISSVMGNGQGSGMGAGAAAGGIIGGLGLASSPVPIVRSGNGLGGPVRTSSGTNSFGQVNQSVVVDGQQVAAAAAPAPIAYEDSAAASIAPNTKTATFDDFFECKLTDPVTIRKNESALVPILQTKVEVDPVTLWSPSAPAPLRALWIRNTSQLTLDRGSFSILESGKFSGQGLLDPIHPGERRLLSYAADQAMRISEDYTGSHNGQTRRVQQITIAKGVWTERAGEVVEHEYLVHNAAPESRTVVVEQPRRARWELDSDTKPEETTPALYRFRVATKPNETVRLHVGERHTIYTRYELANTSPEQVMVLLQQEDNPANVVAAMQPLFAAKQRVVDLDSQIATKTTEINSITNDQNRLRQNLAALKGSAEERALVKRYTTELNAQEDRLAALKSELEPLQMQRSSADADLSSKIQALTLDVSLT